MNNDRELLELAARAAGYTNMIPYKEDWMKYGDWWNPLKNDGDAFCLAVKLKIGQIWALTQWGDMDFEEAIEAYAADPYTAARRAITRAAAEIGKAMG